MSDKTSNNFSMNAECDDMRKMGRESELASAAGSALPICPRCHNSDRMTPYLHMQSYHCDRCRTTWVRDYLNGWNDGFKYATQNEKGEL
jgi:hypothetical protein